MNEPRKRRPAVSSDINTKNLVINSLAIGKSSYDITKETGYPASTIRSYHRNNKELIQER